MKKLNHLLLVGMITLTHMKRDEVIVREDDVEICQALGEILKSVKQAARLYNLGKRELIAEYFQQITTRHYCLEHVLQMRKRGPLYARSASRLLEFFYRWTKDNPESYESFVREITNETYELVQMYLSEYLRLRSPQ